MNHINAPLKVLPNGPYVVACKDTNHGPVIRYNQDGVWHFCTHDLKASSQKAEPSVLSHIIQAIKD